MAHQQEDHLSEFLEIEQERDYYKEQYEKVQKELDEVKIELSRINKTYLKKPIYPFFYIYHTNQ